MDSAIKALLKFGIAFFVGVCILLWAFQPGHTWVYFILIAFVVYIVLGKGSRNLALLGFLLILLLYLFRHEAIDRGIQAVGRSLPQKTVNQAAKTADKLIRSKDPTGPISDTVNASKQLDQNQINQCLRDVVARDAKADNNPNLAIRSQTCATKTGKEFQTCMATNVFNISAPENEISDAGGCSGESAAAPPAAGQKLTNLGLGVLVAAACDAAELANYFPWVNIPTSKCPD